MKKFKVFLLTCALSVLVSGNVRAQASSFGELQAAYIFNFAKYVMWPEPSTKFVVGVYGNVETLKFLQKAFSDKKIAGQPAEVKVVEGEADLADCNIVYVPQTASAYIKTLVSLTSKTHILIVSEEDLIRRGAGISFMVEEGRLRFKLNRAVLHRAGLTATEGLLKLAVLE